MNKLRSMQYQAKTNDMLCLKDFLVQLEAFQAQQPLRPGISMIHQFMEIEKDHIACELKHPKSERICTLKQRSTILL